MTGTLYATVANPDFIAPTQTTYQPVTNIAGSGETPYAYSVLPALGSVDLAFDRNLGGQASSNYLTLPAGPVNGDGTYWVGGLTKLRTPKPAIAGPVAGGPDYATLIASNYYAQAQTYSDQAAASALLVSF